MHQWLLVSFVSLLILPYLLNKGRKLSVFLVEQILLFELQEWVKLYQHILQVWISLQPLLLNLLPLLLIIMQLIKHILLHILNTSFQLATSLHFKTSPLLVLHLGQLRAK